MDQQFGIGTSTHEIQEVSTCTHGVHRSAHEDTPDTDIEQEQMTSEGIPPSQTVASSITNLMNKLSFLSRNCCIYRVPPHVRNLNVRVYSPQTVSIGPFHHNVKELKPMEEHKLRFVKGLQNRTGLNLEECANEISKWEEEIRNSYAEPIKFYGDEFVKIFLTDSCFVIEVICSIFDKASKQQTTYFPEVSFLLDTDLMLLENQLPFFVLDRLYHLAFPKHKKTKFREKCIRYFLHRMVNRHVGEEELYTKVNEYLKEHDDKILHFVDLLRICHLPSQLRQISDKNSYVVTVQQRKGSDKEFYDTTIPKMTELKEAGIHVKKGPSISGLDIKYMHPVGCWPFILKHAVLEIPQVVIDDAAECLLSNILVLEIFIYHYDSYIRDYVYFMHMLIDTPTDVDLLIQKGIIIAKTGDSSSVSNLFNSVGINFPLITAKYYFRQVSRDVNKYCNVCSHKLRAEFNRDYCATPCMAASTIVAIILVGLTLTQTMFTILRAVRVI